MPVFRGWDCEGVGSATLGRLAPRVALCVLVLSNFCSCILFFGNLLEKNYLQMAFTKRSKCQSTKAIK